MNKNLILVVFTTITLAATAQQEQVAKISDKKMYSNGIALLPVLNTLHGGSAVPLHTPEIHLDDDGNFVSGRFSIYRAGSITTGKPRRSCSDTIGFHFFYDYRKVPNLYFAWLTGTEYSLEWSNDRVVSVAINRDWFDIEYDNQGNAIKFYERGAQYGGNIDRYTVSYNPEGKMEKIEHFEERWSDKGKLLYTNLKKSTTYSYSENEVVARHRNFYEGKRPKDNTLRDEQVYTYRKTPNGYVNGTQWTIDNNLKNPSSLDTEARIVEYEIANHRVIKQTIYNKQTPQIADVITYTYDEKGFILTTDNASKTNHINPRIFTTYTYELQSGADPNLEKSYQMSYLSQFFNEKGEVVREATQFKTRSKDENGNWGEWTNFRY